MYVCQIKKPSERNLNLEDFTGVGVPFFNSFPFNTTPSLSVYEKRVSPVSSIMIQYSHNYTDIYIFIYGSLLGLELNEGIDRLI